MSDGFYGILPQLVNELAQSYNNCPVSDSAPSVNMPNKDEIIEIINEMRQLIFPGYFGDKCPQSISVNYYIGKLLLSVEEKIKRQIKNALLYNKNEKQDNEALDEEAGALALSIIKTIPAIREYVAADVQAALDGDPAAISKDQIIYSYPGIFAVSIYRIAHEFNLRNLLLISRIMSEYAHSETGIDIHPGAVIGKYFFIAGIFTNILQ